jgi:hypothetical protein
MNRVELLTVIEKAKQLGQKSLDWLGKQITELSEEIAQLTNLTPSSSGIID